MNTCPYLFFPGNCREAFTLYAKVLGGEIVAMLDHSNMGDANVPPDWGDKIIHARLDIGAQMLLASDIPADSYVAPQGFNISVMLPTLEETNRVWDALADGGTVQSPLAQTFFSAGWGTMTDRFGTPWMISCAPPAG